jgi:hypothetical protein
MTRLSLVFHFYFWINTERLSWDLFAFHQVYSLTYLRDVLFNDATKVRLYSLQWWLVNTNCKGFATDSRLLIWGDIPILGLKKTTKSVHSEILVYGPGSGLNLAPHLTATFILTLDVINMISAFSCILRSLLVSCFGESTVRGEI